MLRDDRTGSDAMTEELARQYHIFETAMGFCAIAWSDAGVARFQLPTKTTRSGRTTNAPSRVWRGAGAAPPEETLPRLSRRRN